MARVAARKRGRRRGARRGKRGARPRGGGRVLLRRAAILLLVALAAMLAWLDVSIRQKFEGTRWAIPAHVYSRPLDLYAGLGLDRERFVATLARLGYRAVPTPSEAGTYSAHAGAVDVVTRANRYWDADEPSRSLRVVFAGGRIGSLTERTSGEAAVVVRLEPSLIGSVSPFHHEDRTLVRLEEVPRELTTALLLMEDRSFARHFGVDPRGLARALWVNIRAGSVQQGGSTITQQLVKNFYLTAERSLQRKFTEMLMAVLLEIHYDKDEILEAYLNEVFLGQAGNRAIHGFGLASHFYFGRPLGELTLPEMAMLVGLVRAPSAYNPRRHPERARARRNLVLEVLAQHGRIDAAELDKLRDAPLGIRRGEPGVATPYPAFVDFVRQQLRRDYRDDDLRSEGLAVHTTLDPQVQQAAAQALRETLPQLEQARALPQGTLEGAIVVVRPDNGEVLAVVGGRRPGFAGFNRALDAYRPVGSLIKPAVYLAALERSAAYTLVTPLRDEPLRVEQRGSPAWEPTNYDRKFHGEVSLLTSLARSYNVPTARLGLDVGIESVIDVLRALGVRRPLAAYPSLLLGATELSPEEVTQVYQTLASGGFRAPLRTIFAVLTAAGSPLRRYPLAVEQAADPGSMYLLNFALQEVVRTGTASALYRTFPAELGIAGKTGTTDDHRDSWFAGYTGNYLAVVWVGRDDNGPTGLTGASGAMRVWANLMRSLDVEPVEMPVPENVVSVSVDTRHGAVAGRGCDGARALPFIRDSAPARVAPCAALSAEDARPRARRHRWPDERSDR